MGSGAYLNKIKAPNYPKDFSRVEYKAKLVAAGGQQLARPQLTVNSIQKDEILFKGPKLVLKQSNIRF